MQKIIKRIIFVAILFAVAAGAYYYYQKRATIPLEQRYRLQAVSYTHLDVYKRQIVGWAFIIIFIGVLPLIAKNIIESHKAKNRILGRDD